MENDSTHNQSDLTEQEQEILTLELQLNEALAADNFFETASGKLVVQLLTKEITRLVKLATSDKFLKDHVGYVNCVAELKANQSLLKRLQVAASPVYRAKLQEKLESYGKSE